MARTPICGLVTCSLFVTLLLLYFTLEPFSLELSSALKKLQVPHVKVEWEDWLGDDVGVNGPIPSLTSHNEVESAKAEELLAQEELREETLEGGADVENVESEVAAKIAKPVLMDKPPCERTFMIHLKGNRGFGSEYTSFIRVAAVAEHYG